LGRVDWADAAARRVRSVEVVYLDEEDQEIARQEIRFQGNPYYPTIEDRYAVIEGINRRRWRSP
jgi:hypothetical protein